jgi:Family of unknown function (DUF6345)/FlgD Ig-like domain/Bacterial Ig domain
MKKIKSGALAFGVLAAFMGQVFCQTNLQFTSVSATVEGAIQLHWASQSNHVYEIDEADSLIDTNTGSTTWNDLYDDYPSQGTNTFWLDTGNYDVVPAIPHPKDSPMRFYRIVDKGPDGLVGDEPTVSIVSPTNGSVISGLLTVTVTASADQGNLFPKFYVDGQVMWPSEDGSNYVINTCEWANGPHVLFATVDSSTAIDGPMNSSGVTGHGVSPFVDVAFSNLISRISFSQQFFQPSLGQTQQVSAVFAANCDWTLTIRDAYSNAVRTVTGSGSSMAFNWDGTGDGGTNIPDGVYYYYIDAQTNGLAPQDLPGGDSSSLKPLSNLTELWATPMNGGDAAPLAIYPPGYDTNNLYIFSASPEEMEAQSSSSISDVESDDDVQPLFSGSSSQSGPPAPLRKPNPPCKGSVGKIAVAYQMYNGNGTNTTSAAVIPDGSGIPGSYVKLNNPYGYGGNVALPYQPFHDADQTAINFVDEMGKGCWDLNDIRHDNELQLSALKGSGTFFNQADIGLLILHGTYGTSYDYTTGHPLYGIYFPIASGGSAQYLKMTDMSLGGSSPTNGLKWMAIMACESLYQKNWDSMISQGAKPYNSNLHMILGALTEFGADPLIGQYWADYMLGDQNQKPPRPPMQIRLAWYNAAYYADIAGVARGVGNYPNPTTFAVVADPSCMDDTLQTNSIPSGGTWLHDSYPIYPPGTPPPTQ